MHVEGIVTVAMIDLHCHILPGIDDGSTDADEACALARALVADGVTTVAATPHLREDHPAVRVGDLAESCRTLNTSLAAAGVSLSVIPGAEVDLLWALQASPEDLYLATYGQMGRYLLLETPYGPLPDTFERMVFECLTSRGLTVLLAHPERSGSFQRDPSRLTDLVARGVLLQVTAPALVSTDRRSGSRRLALWILERRLAHALASDSHGGMDGRPPNLSGARQAAAAIDPAYAEWLVSDAPAAMLAGESLPGAPPDQGASSRRFRLPWRRR